MIGKKEEERTIKKIEKEKYVVKKSKQWIRNEKKEKKREDYLIEILITNKIRRRGEKEREKIIENYKKIEEENKKKRKERNKWKKDENVERYRAKRRIEDMEENLNEEQIKEQEKKEIHVEIDENYYNNEEVKKTKDVIYIYGETDEVAKKYEIFNTKLQNAIKRNENALKIRTAERKRTGYDDYNLKKNVEKIREDMMGIVSYVVRKEKQRKKKKK